MNKKKIVIHIISLCVIFAVLGSALWFIKGQFVAPATTKTSGYFINDVFDSPLTNLENGKTVTQKFTATGDIYGIKVRFHNNGVPQAGSILAEIKDKNGNILLSATANTETLLNDAYTSINFEQPYTIADKGEYTLCLTPNFENKDAYMKIWQDSQSGTIAFGIISYIVSASVVYKWFNLLSVLVILAAFAVYSACFIFKLKKENAFVICLCTVSVLFTFVLPPYSSPDEEAHINSAYSLSNKIFGEASETDIATATVNKRGEDYNKIFEDKQTSVLSYEYIYNNFFKASQNNNVVPHSNSWLVGDFPAVYFIGAIALKIGRVLNLGYVPLLYLGRLFNLAFFALCAYLAVKIAPIGKEIFMVLSMLPITLHLANSFSRDAFVISMAFIFTAWVLYLVYQKERYTAKDIILTLAMCVLLAPSKTIYAEICLLIILLADKNKVNMPKINKKLVVTGAIAIFAVGAAGVMLMVKPYIAQAFAAVPPMEELWVTNPDHTYSLALALANPLVTARLVANTIFSNLSYYVKSVAGGVLGYNSIIISDFFVFIFLALIIISVFKMPQENAKISPLRRLLFLVIFFIEFALVVYVGFSWTPIADKTIYGIQGKYLMPAMPLLLLALKNKVFTVTQDIFKPICFVAAFTNIFVVLNAFVIISQR